MDRFEQNYTRRVRHAFLLVAIIPGIFLVLMMAAPAKLLFLILWIGSILLIVLYLLIIEYLKTHLDRRRKMLLMTSQELIEAMKNPDGGREEA